MAFLQYPLDPTTVSRECISVGTSVFTSTSDMDCNIGELDSIIFATE